MEVWCAHHRSLITQAQGQYCTRMFQADGDPGPRGMWCTETG